MEIKKNSLFTLKIENVAYGGRGIGRWEGVVVFVPFAVPGDVVEARLVKNKGNYIEADLVRVLEPSPIRIAPRCPYFGPCGGCSWQIIPYENQLFLKQEIARSSVEHLSGQSHRTGRLHQLRRMPRRKHRICTRGDEEKRRPGHPPGDRIDCRLSAVPPYRVVLQLHSNEV